MDWRRWLEALPTRIRALLWRARFERDLDDELGFHLAMQTEANREAGVPEAEARRRARVALGSVEAVKERSRDARPLRWARDLMQDLRYAHRSLLRAPGFTAVAIATLALGIGANTALFSVVSAVVLKPLPYPEADRLVRVWTSQPQIGLARSATALPDYRAWRRENGTFDELGAFHFVTYTATGTDRPEVLGATRLTASMWDVLKMPTLHGRVFAAADEQWGAHRVVVLSEPLWRRWFGGDPDVIGRSLQLDGEPFAIIGVMPASFAFPPGVQTELWSPIAYAPGDDMDSRKNRFIDMLGRLKPGVSPVEALADLSTIAERLKQDVPENAGVGVTLESLHESIVGSVRPTLLLLFGAVAFVLLIACANVANLLVARATTRAHELAVRVTLGAGRGRLVRQLLTEHLVLACLGAMGGVLAAATLIHAIPALGATGVPRLEDARIDRPVIAFAALLGVLSAVTAGLWPARHAGRRGLISGLSESTRTLAGGRRTARARRTLVTAEVSLALVLLVGAALLIISLQRLQQVDPGFDPDRLFTATITLPAARYGDAERVARFVHSIVEQAASLPGVLAAGTTTALPLGGREWGKYFSIDGRPAPASLAQIPNVSYRQVTPSYLHTLGVTLRRGRLFTEQDGPDQPLVAIVNETLARRYWPDGDPIGERISMTPPEPLLPRELFPPGVSRLPYRTIVGVIEDIRQNGLARDANAEVFVPLAQLPHGAWREPFVQEFTSTHFLVARTTGDPLASATAIQHIVSRADPSLALANVRAMDSLLSASLAERRFAMRLLGAFAGLALLLALVGLYGVMAYTVSERRKELGVRSALGATPGALLGLVLGDGLRMTLLGVAVGLILAGALSRFMTAHLFGIEAIDPTVYAGVAVLFVAAACLACGVPALQAARLDPITTLRSD